MKQKFSNFLKWFTNLGNIVKTVIGLITFSGLVLGGIRAYNQSVIRKHDAVVKAQTTDQKIDKVLVQLDSTNGQLRSIMSTLDEHGAKLDDVERLGITTKNIVTRNFAKTMTPEQVLEMMNQYDTKKNENYLNEIVLEPSSIWMPYTYKFDHE